MGCSASLPLGIPNKEGASSLLSPPSTHINDPIYMEGSSSLSPQEPVDVGKRANVSTHPTSIEKDMEKEENSEWGQWNVIDFLRLLENEESENKKLTDKEIQSRKDGLYRFMNEAITNIHLMKNSVNEEDKWRDLWLNFELISIILSRIPKIGSLKVDDANKYRREAGEQLSRAKSVSVMCMVVTNGWQKCSKEKGSNTVEPPSDIMIAALSALWNSSDCSPKVTYDIVGDPNFLDTLNNILTFYRPARIEGKEMTEGETHLVESSLSIIHNISNVEENVTPLRGRGFVAIVSPYLNSKTLSDRFKTLASLANIIDEEESEMLQEKDELFEIFLKMLENALKNPDHYCSEHGTSWSAWECTLTIHRLARNHANKKLLVDMGCLPHLVTLVNIGTVEEKREAVGAIWFLAFDKDNQKKILEDTELNIVNLLLAIIEKLEDNVTKEAAYGTLRLLGEELQINEKLKHKVNSYSNVDKLLAVVKRGSSMGITNTKDKKGRIMISYSWSNQKELIKIQDKLQSNGYFVWMDITNMHGSTLQAMGEAVEMAHIVLICMSKKYNESKNCQLEAEYAYQLQKKMVPLKMEADFKPYGWLGIWAGVKLFFDFSGKYKFEAKFKELLNELAEHFHKESLKSQDHGDTVDAAVVSDKPKSVAHPSHQTSLVYIRNWSQTDVDKWLEEYKLSKKEFRHLTGKDIAALARMKAEAAEYFYGYLEKKLKIKNLATLDTFIDALEHL